MGCVSPLLYIFTCTNIGLFYPLTCFLPFYLAILYSGFAHYMKNVLNLFFLEKVLIFDYCIENVLKCRQYL